MPNNVEIERKYLVDVDSFLKVQNQENYPKKEIRQAYWNPQNMVGHFSKTLCYLSESITHLDYSELEILGAENLEMRVRQSDDNYYITFKGKKTLSSGGVKEFEYRINKKFAEDLFAKADFLIEKTRYLVPLNKRLTIEVDVFKDLDGLVMAEIELSSFNEEIPRLPEWIKEEVTGQKEYHNRTLAEKPKFKIR